MPITNHFYFVIAFIHHVYLLYTLDRLYMVYTLLYAWFTLYKWYISYVWYILYAWYIRYITVHNELLKALLQYLIFECLKSLTNLNITFSIGYLLCKVVHVFFYLNFKQWLPKTVSWLAPNPFTHIKSLFVSNYYLFLKGFWMSKRRRSAASSSSPFLVC